MRCRSWKRETKNPLEWKFIENKGNFWWHIWQTFVLFRQHVIEEYHRVVSHRRKGTEAKGKENNNLSSCLFDFADSPIENVFASDVDAHSCDDKRDGKWEKSQNDSNYSSINHSKRERFFLLLFRWAAAAAWCSVQCSTRLNHVSSIHNLSPNTERRQQPWE